MSPELVFFIGRGEVWFRACVGWFVDVEVRSEYVAWVWEKEKYTALVGHHISSRHMQQFADEAQAYICIRHAYDNKLL